MSAIVSALILSASQVALNNLLGDFARSIETSYQDFKIEDQYFSYSNSRSNSNLGFLMKEIKINTLKIPNHSATMNSNKEITLSLSEVNLNFTFRWEYSISHLSDYGRAVFEIPSGKILVKLLVSDSTILKVSSKKVSLDMENLNIQVFKDSNVNQNWMFKMFRKEIEDLIEEFVSGLIDDAIDEFNFGNMYMMVDDEIGFNYSMTESPYVSEKLLKLKSRGIFVQDSKPEYNPPLKKPDLYEEDLDKGIEVLASEYSANSYSYAAYMAGRLDLNITNDTVSEVFPFGLTTTVVGIFIPGLIDKYGSDEPMSLFCTFSEYPLIEFFEEKSWSVQTQVSGVLECDVFVNTEAAIIIRGGALANAKLYLEDWKVKGEIKTLQVNEIKVISSSVDVNEAQIQTTVNDALDSYRKSINDDLLSSGIDLPDSSRFDLKSTKVRSGEGFLLFYSEPRLDFSISDLFDFINNRNLPTIN